MKLVSVICPVYNEELVLPEFHATLMAVLEAIGETYRAEIIYVVDLCPDRSLEILREFARRDERVKIIALSSRFGHQMALLAGMDHARGDAVITLDSDLQHPPSLIPHLLNEFEKGYDVVYTIRNPAPGTGLYRRATSRLFYGFINRLSQIPIEESAADFRLVSARVARVFQTQIRERNQFLRGLMSWVGFKRTGIAFDAQDRGAGRTKYSSGRLLRFRRPARGFRRPSRGFRL